MVVTSEDSRADLAEAMSNYRATLAGITRRGHDGRHKSCGDCDRYAALHASINEAVTYWQLADA